MASQLDDGRIIFNDDKDYWAAARSAYPDPWDFLQAVYDQERRDGDVWPWDIEDWDTPAQSPWDGRDYSHIIMADFASRYARIRPGWVRYCVCRGWDNDGPHWESVDSPGRGCVPVWEIVEAF